MSENSRSTAHQILDKAIDALALPFQAATEAFDKFTAPPGLADGIGRLKIVRFRADHPDNADAPFAGYVTDKTIFAVIGELAASRLYLIVNVTEGTIMSGVFDLSRFEAVPEHLLQQLRTAPSSSDETNPTGTDSPV